jgi:YgiT-type zinc finger domain-containing protein
VICQHGDCKPDKAIVTLNRDNLILVVKGVPAEVCQTCGEEYVDLEVTHRLLQTAKEAARASVQVEVREYVAA